MLGGRRTFGHAIACLCHGHSCYLKQIQICREFLPFFRRPGVVNADTVGAELDMVGIHHSDYRMNLGDELLLLYWNIAIIALQHRKEDQSRCRCHIEISHALMLFACKLIFPEGKV